MRTPAFFHVYYSARNKDHGVGRAPFIEAVALGVMAQYISWGCPRWMYYIVRAAFYK